MDRTEISRIAHADHPVAAPVATEEVRRLVAALEPPHGGRVVDLGCGHGAWLLELLAQRPDLVGTGVDLALPPGRDAAARERGVADRVSWVGGDAAGFDEGPVEAVLCVGASHAFGDAGDAVAAARRLLRPGGAVLWGEATWEQPPSPAAQEALGLGPEDLPDLPGMLDLAREHGFEPVQGHVSTLAEWDHYEWCWTGSLTRWALQPGRDAGERVEALTAARSHREEWVRGYRRELGFVTLVLADAQDSTT